MKELSIKIERDNFNKRYSLEDKEIIVLTNGSYVSCGKSGTDELWTASMGFIAYIDLETKEVRKGEGRVVWLLTESEKEDRESWSGLFKGETIYKLKVKERLDKFVPEEGKTYFYNDFSLMKIEEEDVESLDLEEILEEYRKPVTFNYKSVGEFLFDKNLSFFEGYINWGDSQGFAYLDNIDIEDENTWVEAAENLKGILDNIVVKDREFKNFAAEKLIELANEWNEEEEVKITEEEFSNRISFSSISITPEGEFVIYYNDDDLFWGHIITVYGDVGGKLKDANIEG